MDLDLRQIKNTPYQIVFSQKRLIGLFHNEKLMNIDTIPEVVQKELDLLNISKEA